MSLHQLRPTPVHQLRPTPVLTVWAPLLALALSAGTVCAQTGTAAAPPVSGVVANVVTHHAITIRGVRVEYDATVGSVTVRDSANQPIGVMGYFAYARTGTDDARNRPILFAYNGGPGSASLILHLAVLGPRRLATTDSGHVATPVRLVDNAYSPLDRADLVFIDPIGTGFSHITGRGAPKDFFGARGDAQSVAQFISRYLTEKGRRSSPVFILGESYGTTRNALVAEMLEKDYKIPVLGAAFISSSLDGNTIWETSGHLEPYLFYLPSYAAAAWFHHRLPHQPAQLRPFLDEVRKFATTEFVTALFAWPNIAPAEKAHLLEKLHDYTGLSASYWEKKNLRVGSADFARELLRDQGLVLSMDNSRETSPVNGPEVDATAEFGPAFRRYMHDELGVHDVATYIPLAHLGSWDWMPYGRRGNRITILPNLLDNVAAAMKANPHMHVSLQSGIYDLKTPPFPAEWSMARMDIPDSLRDNVRMASYEGGHMMYLVPSEFLKFTHDIAEFIDASMKDRTPR